MIPAQNDTYLNLVRLGHIRQTNATRKIVIHCTCPSESVYRHMVHCSRHGYGNDDALRRSLSCNDENNKEQVFGSGEEGKKTKGKVQ